MFTVDSMTCCDIQDISGRTGMCGSEYDLFELRSHALRTPKHLTKLGIEQCSNKDLKPERTSETINLLTMGCLKKRRGGECDRFYSLREKQK